MPVGVLRRWFGKRDSEPIAYGEAKRSAADRDPNRRLRLARREDTKPEILYYLATDEATEVRRAIAANKGTPRQADLVLARDEDEVVRGDLAEKIARVAPQLSPEQQDAVYRLTVEVLEVLARDQATRVRRILAEALKDVANAPPGVIRRLASDVELVVAGPVLERSPVLTDEDLLGIIRDGAASGAIAAISRRRTVGERLSDAIVEAGENDAIASLLGNPSAQIREETLDRLVDQAANVDAWHEPLARRPKLSAGAVRRLACFVARSLLDVLMERQDLDAATAQAVAQVVERRLAEESPEPAGQKADTKAKRKSRREAGAMPEDRALSLMSEGKLGEEEILAALGRGERAFVMASVAGLAGVSVALVEQVFSMHSAKGVVALAWKANLAMRVAVQLQTRLAGITPKDILRPSDGNRYPLTDADMEWQLEFFEGMAPVKA